MCFPSSLGVWGRTSETSEDSQRQQPEQEWRRGAQRHLQAHWHPRWPEGKASGLAQHSTHSSSAFLMPGRLPHPIEPVHGVVCARQLDHGDSVRQIAAAALLLLPLRRLCCSCARHAVWNDQTRRAAFHSTSMPAPAAHLHAALSSSVVTDGTVPSPVRCQRNVFCGLGVTFWQGWRPFFCLAAASLLVLAAAAQRRVSVETRRGLPLCIGMECTVRLLPLVAQAPAVRP